MAITRNFLGFDIQFGTTAPTGTAREIGTPFYVTSDGTSGGTILEQWVYTRDGWLKANAAPPAETVTELSLAANILSYVDEAGNTTNIDLSLYLDDTNLARLVSGTLDGTTGIATFTRDDNTTFTVDLSALNIKRLQDLTDVDVTTSAPVDQDVLTWDATDSKWVPGAPVRAMDDLSDATITSPAPGHALVYDGAQWVNQALPSGVTELQALDDVDVITYAPEEGDVLVWNATDSKWVAAYVPKVIPREDTTGVSTPSTLAQVQKPGTPLTNAYQQCVSATPDLTKIITARASGGDYDVMLSTDGGLTFQDTGVNFGTIFPNFPIYFNGKFLYRSNGNVVALREDMSGIDVSYNGDFYLSAPFKVNGVMTIAGTTSDGSSKFISTDAVTWSPVTNMVFGYEYGFAMVSYGAGKYISSVGNYAANKTTIHIHDALNTAPSSSVDITGITTAKTLVFSEPRQVWYVVGPSSDGNEKVFVSGKNDPSTWTLVYTAATDTDASLSYHLLADGTFIFPVVKTTAPKSVSLVAVNADNTTTNLGIISSTENVGTSSITSTIINGYPSAKGGFMLYRGTSYSFIAYEVSGSGASNSVILPEYVIDDLDNVNVAGKQDGNFLTWDSTTSKWIATTPTYSLNDLTDVTITSAANNQFLRHNGSQWVNTLVNVGTLADVNTTGVANRDVLAYDSATSTWKPVDHYTHIQAGTTSTASTATHTIDGSKQSLHFVTVSTAVSTININNVPVASTTDALASTYSIILKQGGTPYIPSNWQVNGTATTLRWAGGTAPTVGTASGYDVITINLMRVSGAFIALAQMVSFG